MIYVTYDSGDVAIRVTKDSKYLNIDAPNDKDFMKLLLKSFADMFHTSMENIMKYDKGRPEAPEKLRRLFRNAYLAIMSGSNEEYTDYMQSFKDSITIDSIIFKINEDTFEAIPMVASAKARSLIGIILYIMTHFSSFLYGDIESITFGTELETIMKNGANYD